MNSVPRTCVKIKRIDPTVLYSDLHTCTVTLITHTHTHTDIIHMHYNNKRKKRKESLVYVDQKVKRTPMQTNFGSH